MPELDKKREEALARMRKVYGARSNKEMLRRAFEMALRGAKFCEEMGIVTPEPKLH